MDIDDDTVSEWRDALQAALSDYQDKEAGIERGDAIKCLAMHVIKLAMGGDRGAIEEIGNRLDGKPRQLVDHLVEISASDD